MERLLCQGKSKTQISREFGVSTDSLSNHLANHVSRQMAQSWSRKSGLEVMGLMADIEDLVSKARLIFDRNFAKNSTTGDLTALNALREQRGVFELLVKIAALFHEAKLLELESSQAHLEKEREVETQEQLARLTYQELEIFYYIRQKMEGEEVADADVPDIFKAAAPQAPHRPPLPLPAPKLPPASAHTPPYGDDLPGPGDSPGEPEEQELEPEPPPGLPPAPVREIPGGGRGMRLRRHLFGRKVLDGLKER